MSVIVWDGKTLAADKQATYGGVAQTVTKIFKLEDGSLVGFAGTVAHAKAMLEWFKAGAVQKDWPKPGGTEAPCDVMHISTTLVITEFTGHCNGYGDIVEDGYSVLGSGRDFAFAAMHLGLNAEEAAKVACELDINCGRGIMTLTPGVENET